MVMLSVYNVLYHSASITNGCSAFTELAQCLYLGCTGTSMPYINTVLPLGLTFQCLVDCQFTSGSYVSLWVTADSIDLCEESQYGLSEANGASSSWLIPLLAVPQLSNLLHWEWFLFTLRNTSTDLQLRADTQSWGKKRCSIFCLIFF